MTCAAFANSAGGFLLFGIRDGRSADLSDRIVGVPPALDLPEHFGSFPQQCVPSVAWEFRNPPVLLPNGNAIHVIHIPPSSRAPHAIGAPSHGWTFPKRTNQGNDYMSFSEVQTAMLGYYEKRLKLQLLRGELMQVLQAASEIIQSTKPDGSNYSVITIELTVIESVLADTYSITHRSPRFVSLMTQIRSAPRWPPPWTRTGRVRPCTGP